MTFPYRVLMLCVLFGIGGVRALQQTTLLVKSYEVSARQTEWQELKTHTAWLQARVELLRSPQQLAQIAEERKLSLIAWSELSEDSRLRSQLAQAPLPHYSPAPKTNLVSGQAEQPDQGISD